MPYSVSICKQCLHCQTKSYCCCPVIICRCWTLPSPGCHCPMPLVVSSHQYCENLLPLDCPDPGHTTSSNATPHSTPTAFFHYPGQRSSSFYSWFNPFAVESSPGNVDTARYQGNCGPVLVLALHSFFCICSWSHSILFRDACPLSSSCNRICCKHGWSIHCWYLWLAAPHDFLLGLPDSFMHFTSLTLTDDSLDLSMLDVHFPFFCESENFFLSRRRSCSDTFLLGLQCLKICGCLVRWLGLFSACTLRIFGTP